ncbi:MAG: RNA 3'-terminal phosphate cyclase [Desulfuromonadaceae bacterium]
MLTIDGSSGEGGGQILRSSLALALVTGRPFRIENIRARRTRPGLMRQHLTAVNAAVEIGNADVEGNHIGSQDLSFHPRTIRPGRYHFAIGTAGSCTLVLQTVLPALCLAPSASELVLEGGTHNPHAPPFDFLQRSFLPQLQKMGPRVELALERPGFYPAGGGRMLARIEPVPRLTPLELRERGPILERRACAAIAQLARHIAERELRLVRSKLSWSAKELSIQEVEGSSGPGNVLMLEVASKQVREIFTGFGEWGVSAEKVAGRTVKQVQKYLAAEVPVGPHLADQLLLPLALAGGGAFRTLAPTRHTTTNIEVIKIFLDVGITLERLTDEVWEIRLSPNSGAKS